MVICHINSTTHIPVQLLHFLTIILLGTGMSSAGLSQNKIRLSNPVTITVPGVEIDAISMLPDNETIAVVGGKPRGPTETDLAYTQQQPSGATVNIRSKQVRTFTNSHTVRINSVACSPDGLRLFTVSSHRDPFLRIWDVTTGKTVDSIPLNKEGGFPDFKVACFTGSQQIAVTDGKAIAVLDPTKRRQFAFSSDTLANSSVSNLAVSPGDKYIACYTFKNQLVIWDIRSKKVVYSPSLLPEDGTRQGWVIQSMFFTRNGTQLIIARRGKNDEIPNGTVEEKVAAKNRGLLLIDIQRKEVIALGMGHQIMTFAFSVHPSERWIATVGRSRPDKHDEKDTPLFVQELRIYDYPSRTLAFRLQFDNEFSPNEVRFTPDGKKLVGVAPNGKVRCWDFKPSKR